MSEQQIDYHHAGFDFCPVSNMSMRVRYVWTDHKRPGSFNSCEACNKENPETLQELNARRGRTLKAKGRRYSR